MGLGWVGRTLRRIVPAVIAVAGVAGLLTGACAGHRFVTSATHFQVASIEVVGQSRLSDERVHELLALPMPAAMPAGASAGMNLFELELSALERALEADPWVADALVRRRLPDTVVVEIDEHQPAALVEMDGLYLADSEGRVFARASIEHDDGRGLPVLTGVRRERYRDDPQAAQATIRRGLMAANLYAEAGEHASARPRLGEVHFDPRRGITFFSYDTAMAVRVGHGSSELLRARLEAFDLAWQALSPDERMRVRVVYADGHTRLDRITVSFAEASD